ncbi:MAG: helix-turn-helix transcriptional regulator [Chloroflexota bacterium]|jgi:transcriptional regulator with XRE-family HTH domain
MSEIDSSRAKYLGTLIAEARENAALLAGDCAQALGMPVEAYEQAERGELPLSLPQLEVLAMFMKVPMAYFWRGEAMQKSPETDFATYMSLRQRIVGVSLRQARVDAGWSVERLADEADLSVEEVEAFERGDRPIPYLLLASLADLLDVSLNDFTLEPEGPLGRHERALARRQNFEDLPEDVQAFVAEPGNLIYLQTAMRLSDLDVDRLRAIAEGILDITF